MTDNQQMEAGSMYGYGGYLLEKAIVIIGMVLRLENIPEVRPIMESKSLLVNIAIPSQNE